MTSLVLINTYGCCVEAYWLHLHRREKSLFLDSPNDGCNTLDLNLGKFYQSAPWGYEEK